MVTDVVRLNCFSTIIGATTKVNWMNCTQGHRNLEVE
jgi:hypothetical protein